MDGWGIAIFAVFMILYLLTKKKYPLLLFLSGIGAGILIGAIWSMFAISRPFFIRI